MHRNLGTVTCSLVGNPTTGRSTNRRVVWSRSLPGCPQSGHTPVTATGVASMMVSGPASAAPVMASPISAVRQMVSATRFPVGFASQHGSLVGLDGCVGTFIFTPGTPICCGDPLNPSCSISPHYAPQNRKSQITFLPNPTGLDIRCLPNGGQVPVLSDAYLLRPPYQC